MGHNKKMEAKNKQNTATTFLHPPLPRIHHPKFSSLRSRLLRPLLLCPSVLPAHVGKHMGGHLTSARHRLNWAPSPLFVASCCSGVFFFGVRAFRREQWCSRLGWGCLWWGIFFHRVLPGPSIQGLVNVHFCCHTGLVTFFCTDSFLGNLGLGLGTCFGVFSIKRPVGVVVCFLFLVCFFLLFFVC